MSTFDDNYSTLEEHQESLRSPIFPRSVPNFASSDTPPPLVDLPEEYEPSDIGLEPQGTRSTFHRTSKTQSQPPLSDTLLVSQLGCDPEIAAQAGEILCCDSPDTPCEDRSPCSVYAMIAGPFHQDVLSTSEQQLFAEQALTAPRRASEKLNGAMGFVPHGYRAHSITQHGNVVTQSQYSFVEKRDRKQISIDITSLTNDDAPNSLQVSHLSITTPAHNRKLDVQPPCRPVLPSLQINDRPSTQVQGSHKTVATSAALVKFAITPLDGDPSHTLPRLQNHVSPISATSRSPERRQTLPSLETALNSAIDYNGAPYFEPSPAPTRLSSNQYNRFSPTSTYSQPQSTTTLSPPRLSAKPADWRTLSHNSSNSTVSDYASGGGSNQSSTPATHDSPSHSASTPHYALSESDSVPEHDPTMFGAIPDSESGIAFNGASASQGYVCAYPGCTAPPFQTQYLLNSHTNVHSNQRPHFCLVGGCPRGPGGQGFKRKNEMIRHGLVHTSPGYICPFCSDQQHKYPRPDNLQRHVRVHHADKDRDDPLLRDVLAQRAEGGNRGRRRRLGS